MYCFYLTAIAAAAGHWLLGAAAKADHESEKTAWALSLEDVELQGSGKAASAGSAQTSTACPVVVVAAAGQGKSPHGSAGIFRTVHEASTTGVLPAAAADVKPVNQKSSGWAFLEVVGVSTHDHGSSATPASEPRAGHAASGNASCEEGAVDVLPQGSAGMVVSTLNARGCEGS